jgi:hypothetical protein
LKQLKEAQNQDFDGKYKEYSFNNSSNPPSAIGKPQVNLNHRLWFICDSDLIDNLPC